jgi:hypothetical protein
VPMLGLGAPPMLGGAPFQSVNHIGWDVAYE